MPLPHPRLAQQLHSGARQPNLAVHLFALHPSGLHPVRFYIARRRATCTHPNGFGNVLRPDGRQQSDWRTVRLGPTVPDSSVELLQLATTYTAEALGIPPELMQSGSSSSALREAQRMLFHGTLQPLARPIESELRIKLEQPALTVDLSALSAVDTQGKARALKRAELRLAPRMSVSERFPAN